MPPKGRSSTGSSSGGAKARSSSSVNAFSSKGKAQSASGASSAAGGKGKQGALGRSGSSGLATASAQLLDGDKKQGGLQRTPSGENVLPREYSKEELARAEKLPELDVDDPSWDAYWEVVQKKMGLPRSQPIHAEGQNRIHHMLRTFDLDPTYGPAIGMTRLQRWHRAKALGDEPPEEVRAILETRQGALEHADHIFVGTGI